MSTTIRIKKSGTASNTPGTLEFGELAINYADGKLFYKDATGNIQQFSSGGNINAFETVNANGSLLIADSNTDILNIIAGTGIDISGNTVSDTFTITSRLDNTVTSTSTTSAATPAAVNAVHTIATGAYTLANSNYLPAVTRLNVTAPGIYYSIDQYSGNNPTLYIRAGETLAFNLSVSGHPFMIRVSSGGANYNTGLTHVAANGAISTDGSAQGQVSGTLYWKVPFELQGNTYVYQCSVHSGMVGNVVIEQPTANVLSVATSAYGQANAAYTQANAAYVQANAAYTKANAPITIREIYSSNGNVINSFANINTIQFDTESGLAVVDESNNAVTIQLNSTFKYWNINGNPGLVATGLDTVNFIGSGITITANNNASPKTITFTSTGGGGGGSNTEIIVDSNTVVAQTNTFTLSQNVNAISQLVVAKNGLQLTPNLHFIVSGNTVTLNAVAEINDVMTFTNFRSVTGTSSGAGLTQYSYNTTTSSIETVDEWSKSTYRSAKYQMQVESGAGYYSTDIMLIHDGVSTNLVQYGTVSFASNVGVFSSDISGSNVRLRFTATDATSNLTYFRTILANRASESLPSDLMNGSDSYDLMLTLPFNPTDLN
jgi:plastocyanin